MTLARIQRYEGSINEKSKMLESPFELIVGYKVETFSPSETLKTVKRLLCEVQAAINSPFVEKAIFEIGKFLSIEIPSKDCPNPD